MGGVNIPLSLLVALIMILGTGCLTYVAWMTKTILKHAEIMAKLEVEFTSTNRLALATAGELAAIVKATADALADKVDHQAAELALLTEQKAADLAAKVEATAATLAQTPLTRPTPRGWPGPAGVGR